MDDLAKVLGPLIKQFMPFAQKRMGFDKPPRLFLRHDTKNAGNPLGRTAHYDPSAQSVSLYTTGRHIKDIMRSLSHELVHHAQCCRGEFNGGAPTGAGYAQTDDHMREMEREAYELGNMCFRDWEDSVKNTIYYEHLHKVEKMMSTKDWKNGELTQLLSEAWGFKFDTELLGEGRTPVQDEGEPLNKDDKMNKLEEEDGADKGDQRAGEKDYKDFKDTDPGYHGKTGASHGDQGKKRRAYMQEDGAKKGDQSASRVDYPDAKDGDKKRGHGESAGDQSKTKGDYLKEDSGEDEAWHQWKNEHADDDHIREIEYHLRALKHDRDYERDEAEYDHDKYEDEGEPMEEMESRATNREMAGKGSDERLKPSLGEAQIRKLVRERLQAMMENKKGESNK